MALTKSQDRVLCVLYEQRDARSPPNIEQIAKGAGLSEAATRRVLVELRELGMVAGPPSLCEQVEEALKELDPKIQPTSPGFQECVIVVASAFADANEKSLAAELGYDQEFVSTVGSRLRAAGIWSGDTLHPDRREAWLADSAALLLDMNVATGDLMVVGGTVKNPQYQTTKQGDVAAATRIKRKGRSS